MAKVKAPEVPPVDFKASKLQMRVSDFLMGPGKDFAMYDNFRKIPQLADGFKPSQRKAIYGALKSLGENGQTSTVERLAAAVADATSYHHGTGSLEGTIAGLGAHFCGANNVSLMLAEGQFGNRLSPTPGAARYIESGIAPSFRKLFKKEDDIILEYNTENNLQLEPVHYFPLLPMSLVNGSDGTGVGFASYILNYNPDDLRKYILASLQGKKKPRLIPWYAGYTGKIEKNAETNQITFTGVVEVVNTTKLHISELPIGLYDDDIRKTLIKLKDAEWIKNFEDRSTTTEVDIDVMVPRTSTIEDHDFILNKLKLIKRETENFTLWLPGYTQIKKFAGPEEVCDYFITFRLEKYELRRTTQIKLYDTELEWLKEKIRFIEFFIKNSEQFSKWKKTELETRLQKEGFTQIDRLLDIKIYNMTNEQIAKLKEDIKSVEQKIKELKKTTNVEMYIRELEDLKL